MNVNLFIERLVLDGFDLSPRERRVLETAVATELTHLITSEGLPPTWRSGGAVPGAPALPMQLTADRRPTELGRQIARSVYGGLRK